MPLLFGVSFWMVCAFFRLRFLYLSVIRSACCGSSAFFLVVYLCGKFAAVGIPAFCPYCGVVVGRLGDAAVSLASLFRSGTLFSHESTFSIRSAPRVSTTVRHSPVPPSTFLRPRSCGLSVVFPLHFPV